MINVKNGREVKYLGYGYNENNIYKEAIIKFMKYSLEKEGLESMLTGKIVDLGCGDGGVLNELSKQYFIEPVGVDLFPIKKYDNISYLEEDILKTSIPDKSANIVYCVNLLTALDDAISPRDLFKEIDRILAPGGLFIVMSDSGDFVIDVFGDLIDIKEIREKWTITLNLKL